MKKKPDYLIMIFTLIIVIGIFLFLRDALAGKVNALTHSEIQAAAGLGHIESVEYKLVGGDNYDLVIVSGSIYKQYASLPIYDNVLLFERVMRIDQAQAIQLCQHLLLNQSETIQ